MTDTPPPSVVRSPQATSIELPPGTPSPCITGTLSLTLQTIRRCGMSRERLSDWHSKIRGKR